MEVLNELTQLRHVEKVMVIPFAARNLRLHVGLEH